METTYRLVISEYANEEWELGHSATNQRTVLLKQMRERGGQSEVLSGRLDNGDRIVVKMGTAERKKSEDCPNDEAKFYREEYCMLKEVASERLAPLPFGFGSVEVKTAGEQGEQTWTAVAFAEEFIEGETLAKFIDARSSGGHSVGEIAAVCSHLAAKLVVLDKHGLSHRDLKPQNIIVQSGLAIKLIDFGLATEQVAAITLDRGLAASLPYASPEKVFRYDTYAGAGEDGLRGDKSIKVDVYALSQIALCMRMVGSICRNEQAFRTKVTGNYAELGNPAVNQSYRRSRNKCAKLTNYVEEQDRQLGDKVLALIIDRATEQNPDNRPSPRRMMCAFDALSAWSQERGAARISEGDLVERIGSMFDAANDPDVPIETCKPVASPPTPTVTPHVSAASSDAARSARIASAPAHPAPATRPSYPSSEGKPLESFMDIALGRAGVAPREDDARTVPASRATSAPHSAAVVGTAHLKQDEASYAKTPSTLDLSEVDRALLKKIADVGSCEALVHAMLNPFLDTSECKSAVTFSLEAPKKHSDYLPAAAYRPCLRFLSYAWWMPLTVSRHSSEVPASGGSKQKGAWYVSVTDEVPTVEDIMNVMRSMDSGMSPSVQHVRWALACPPTEQPIDFNAWRGDEVLRARFDHVELLECSHASQRRDLAHVLFADSRLMVPRRRPLSKGWMGRSARVTCVVWRDNGTAVVGLSRNEPIDIENALEGVTPDEHEQRRLRLLATRLYCLPVGNRIEFDVLRELFNTAEEAVPVGYKLTERVVNQSLERFGGPRGLLDKLDRL